ncbi:MAG: Fe-S cluster assembly protein SufD [Gemmataceae bacterium]|nr:Fe-S cluster assembly protein SufD [Gemmataceae bacterium]
MDKTTFTNLFTPFDRDNAAPKYRALRQSGRERLGSLAWPTTRCEDWRFTSVAPIVETTFALPVKCDDLKLPAATNTLRLVFVNGRFAKALSAPIAAGLQVGSLADAGANVALLAQIAADKDNAFTAMNTSFLCDGAYVVISDGQVVEQPIEIVYLSRSTDKPIVSHPRTLIVVGKNAQATVVERYQGDGAYFTNAVTEISLAEGAVLDHVKLQQESLQAYHIANTQIVQGARSTFTSHYLSLGGALVRNEVRVRFDGEHAESTVNGLYLASGKQHMDNFTVIDHAQPNCASHELYKGILDERAHGVFNGKIFVRKDAQKTDAKQTNKVLLLSDDATINTKPQLEIFADDVKCTHGATIGQLDATQLFYLQSRGIPLDAARRLLTFAFANDVVNRVKIEAIRAELEERIVR